MVSNSTLHHHSPIIHVLKSLVANLRRGPKVKIRPLPLTATEILTTEPEPKPAVLATENTMQN